MNLGSLLSGVSSFAGGPLSGFSNVGGPMSGMGILSGIISPKNSPTPDAQTPPPAGTTPGMTQDKRKKKEGIASILSGLGKGHGTVGDLEMPQQQGIDLQSLLGSLFGG